MGIAEFAPYLEAAALGLLVGLERDWAKRDSEQEAVGARTYAVLAVAGAVAGSAGAVVLAGGAVAIGFLLSVGYLRTALDDRGLTSEVAALTVYLLGALTLTHAALAVGAAVVLTSLLAAKEPIHRVSRQFLTEVEVSDGLRFLVAAFVILPLVPHRALGPYGALNPFKIWVLVVTLTGIGWLGYIAVRALGQRRGLAVTGFAGGFVSATATSANLARLARHDRAAATPALAGVLLASAATLVQMLVVLSVVNPRVVASIAPGAASGLAVLAIEVAVLFRRSGPATPTAAPLADSAGSAAPPRPFQLKPALILAAALTAITLTARWATIHVGAGGTLATAALAGFADAHAPSLAIAMLAGTGAVATHTAALAVGCALATNTVSKWVLTYAVGGRAFGHRFVLAMLLPVIATSAGLSLTLAG